jgi:hypothetical protein
MTEDHARILAFNRRLNEISGNTSKPGTRIIDVMDADAVTVPKSDFLHIERQLLVIGLCHFGLKVVRFTVAW